MRPYDVEALPTYETIHATVPVSRVDPRRLFPTQEFAVIERLVALATGGRREGPDPYPHVVAVEGRGLYVHNGHHGWLRALLRDEPLDVRVVVSPKRQDGL